MSDDNPFSEAQFKTLKYHPSFPGRFADQGQAKTFCRSFFRWYNAEHRHGGISMLTPEQVHFGQADDVIARRTTVLNTAWTAPSRNASSEVCRSQTAPGGRLDQSSHLIPLHTGNCSLINPHQCPIVVDRFRFGQDALEGSTAFWSEPHTESSAPGAQRRPSACSVQNEVSSIEDELQLGVPGSARFLSVLQDSVDPPLRGFQG